MCLSTAKDYDYVIKAKARNFLVTSWLRRLFGAQSSSDLSISVGWSGSCVDFAEDLHTSIVCVWGVFEPMRTWALDGSCAISSACLDLIWSACVSLCLHVYAMQYVTQYIYIIYDTYEYPHVLFMIVSLLFPSIPVMYNHEPSSK